MSMRDLWYFGLTSQTHLVSYDNGLLCFLLDFVALFATNESLTEGYIYEAQLSNSSLGEYHGYPMKDGDKFADFVRTEWERRSQ